jgi:hypothetical protein
MGYLSTVSGGNFYNINARDVFKISLSDISNPGIIANLGIQPDVRFSPKSGNNAQLTDLMFFAFAVRVPYLRRSTGKGKDRFLSELFNACLAKGANDNGGIVGETFKVNMKTAKSKRIEPPFSGEWFRRWVYSHGADNSPDSVNLAAINNQNIFLLGCMDALLPLYYAKLTEVLLNVMNSEQ